MRGDRSPASRGDGVATRAHGALEPELDWNVILEGRTFLEVPLVLDDDAIDSYLGVTGESHPLFAKGPHGLAPPMYTTLVRFAKASLGGRWPSGTIQLDHRLAFFRPFSRGERLTIDVRIRTAETRNGRPHFEAVSIMRDANRVAVGEQTSTSIWAGALPGGGLPEGALPSRTLPGVMPAASLSAPRPSLGAGNPVSTDPVNETNARIGPVAARFSLSMLRDFGEVAGALDPIHVDPVFARGTRYGENVVQGRLAMTLLARLMLEYWGEDWLDGGELAVRFRKPLFVDQAAWAWGLPLSAGQRGFAVWCENERGEKVVEGVARIGAMSPAGSLSDRKSTDIR